MNVKDRLASIDNAVVLVRVALHGGEDAPRNIDSGDLLQAPRALSDDVRERLVVAPLRAF